MHNEPHSTMARDAVICAREGIIILDGMTPRLQTNKVDPIREHNYSKANNTTALAQDDIESQRHNTQVVLEPA